MLLRRGGVARQRVKAVTHVVQLLNFVQDRPFGSMRFATLLKGLRIERTSDEQMNTRKFEKLEKGFAVYLRNPHKNKQDQATLSMHPVCANCANESIPNPRHRAKTAPQEQSTQFPLLYLTFKRKLD